ARYAPPTRRARTYAQPPQPATTLRATARRARRSTQSARMERRRLLHRRPFAPARERRHRAPPAPAAAFEDNSRYRPPHRRARTAPEFSPRGNLGEQSKMPLRALIPIEMRRAVESRNPQPVAQRRIAKNRTQI